MGTKWKFENRPFPILQTRLSTNKNKMNSRKTRLKYEDGVLYNIAIGDTLGGDSMAVIWRFLDTMSQLCMFYRVEREKRERKACLLAANALDAEFPRRQGSTRPSWMVHSLDKPRFWRLESHLGWIWINNSSPMRSAFFSFFLFTGLCSCRLLRREIC